MAAETSITVEEQGTVATAHAEEPAGVLGTLGINGSQFIGHLLNFAIIVVVMWKFVYKPLLAKMDERETKIREGLDFAKSATHHLHEAEREREEIVRTARAEAHAMIEKATQQTEDMRKEKLERAKAEVEKVVEEAKERIREEREAAYKTLKRDMANLIVAATEKSLEGLDEKSRKTIVHQAVKDLKNA